HHTRGLHNSWDSLRIEKQMKKAAAELDFEQAAILRDQMLECKSYLK
ncbi:MAG: UvrB/UvrC motif-containing protein, partial [Firmicutes bacterium]|nr:UvrB/UvrC motif-containing protein [Bacillota bacterium]